MTRSLKSELKKLTLVEKLALLDQIEGEVAALGCPPGVMSEDDPKLGAELDRRWREIQHYPERLMTLSEFKASFGDK
jgi:hypothetical protein